MENYDIYLKDKKLYDNAMGFDWSESMGKGKDLQELAKRAIAGYALCDGLNTQQMGLAIVEMIELVSLLDNVQDDYVEIRHTPEGSWELH